MTSRLQTPVSSPDWARYDTLVAEALIAFEQDVIYAIQVLEAARSSSSKKRTTQKRKS